jgi:chaperonin GroEL
MHDKDNIHNGPEALAKLYAGIEKTVGVIRSSYGAAGGNVIVEEQLPPFHRVTNDGKMSIDYIRLADPVEHMGANIAKEVGDKADKDSGDGRKTTLILFEEIIKAAKDSNLTPNELRRQLKACEPAIIAAIDAQKRPIEIKDVKSVALVSSESEELAELFQQIYDIIGKDGIVEIDHSGLTTSYFEVTEGIRLRGAKAFGAYAYTEQGKAVYNKPAILVTKEKIATVEQIEGIVTKVMAMGKNELVIYCEDIDLSVASRLAQIHLSGGFKTLLVKSPVLWKDWLYEDLQKITGATAISPITGVTFKNFKTEYLGTCEKLVASDAEVRVIGIRDIKDHVADLEAKGQTDDQQKLRASWLNTRVAILKVGAQSESELSYLSKKAKDSTAAVYLALKDGVVAGGGLALVNARKALPSNEAGSILSAALIAPARQLVENADATIEDGDTPQVSLKEGDNTVLYPLRDSLTFDVKLMKGTDAFEAGIIDPAIVVKNAIRNAISIASTTITNRGIITLPKFPQQHENPRNMPVVR